MLLSLNEFAKDIERVTECVKKDFGPGQVMDITCFVQTWDSTALGFNGCGGSALTPAVTTIIEMWGHSNRKKYYVFFGGSFAYCVDEPNEAFLEDMKQHFMVDVDTAKTKYYDNNV